MGSKRVAASGRLGGAPFESLRANGLIPVMLGLPKHAGPTLNPPHPGPLPRWGEGNSGLFPLGHFGCGADLALGLKPVLQLIATLAPALLVELVGTMGDPLVQDRLVGLCLAGGRDRTLLCGRTLGSGRGRRFTRLHVPLPSLWQGTSIHHSVDE